MDSFEEQLNDLEEQAFLEFKEKINRPTPEGFNFWRTPMVAFICPACGGNLRVAKGYLFSGCPTLTRHFPLRMEIEQGNFCIPISILQKYWWDPGIQGQFAPLLDWLIIENTSCNSCGKEPGQRCTGEDERVFYMCLSRELRWKEKLYS